MLFAAVTLGFFAENLREHQIEKHREIKYLENIHLDLQRDIKEIDKVIQFNTEKQKFGDELYALLQKGVKTDLPKFYYLIKSLSLRMFFEHSESGLTQLKNAGGLRLIEENEIINKIQLLELRVSNIESLQQAMDQNLLYFRLKTNTLLDAKTNWEMNQKQSLDYTKAFNIRRFSVPESANPLFNDNEKDINELVNLAIAPINTIRYIDGHLTQLKAQCIQLDSILVEKYGHEFHE